MLVMRACRGGLFLALVLLPAAAMSEGAEELVKNGRFEAGKGKQPSQWSKIDGLTTFWAAKGNPGRCLRFDPTVLQVDKKAFEENPEAFAGRRKGGQYSTVGAHEGVWVFSAPIPVKPDDRYFIIEADVMGPKSTRLFYPQVFIRGYQKFTPGKDDGSSSYFHVPHAGGPAYSEVFGSKQREAKDGDYLQVFRSHLICGLEQPGKWQHFAMGLKLPSMKKYRPDVLLLKPYAMWPLGDYLFDNISLRRCTEDEYRAAKFRGHKDRGPQQRSRTRHSRQRQPSPKRP